MAMDELSNWQATASLSRTVADPSRGPLEEIWLLGQPGLASYLDYVRDMTVGGATVDLSAVFEEWQRANDYYHELEEGEAWIADGAECLPLPPALEPLAEEVRAHPHFGNTFDVLPTTFAMVELDRLVVSQNHVTRQFAEAIKARLGPAPSQEAVFDLCFPRGHRDTPLEIRRLGSRRYAFSSDSTDLRFHDSVLLSAEQIPGYHSFGPIGGAVGLVVGFSSNFLNVVRSDNRLMLHNGYHRAYALRALGVRHVPCILRTVTRRAELDLVASDRVREHAALYFKSARPPLLKDFFDPRIRKVLQVQRTRKVIEVSFEVREYDVSE